MKAFNRGESCHYVIFGFEETGALSHTSYLICTMAVFRDPFSPHWGQAEPFPYLYGSSPSSRLCARSLAVTPLSEQQIFLWEVVAMSLALSSGKGQNGEEAT